MALERTSVARPLPDLQTLVSHWWAVVLRGVVAVLFGILALASPAAGLGTLIVLFGVFALISGVLTLAAAIRAGREHHSWGAMVLEGVLNLAAGVVALVWPSATTVVLVYLFAFWALTIGITEMVDAFRLRRLLSQGWLLEVSGALSIAFGIYALIRPHIGAKALVVVLGIYALLFGISLIGLGLRLGGFKRRLSRVEV